MNVTHRAYDMMKTLQHRCEKNAAYWEGIADTNVECEEIRALALRNVSFWAEQALHCYRLTQSPSFTK